MYNIVSRCVQNSIFQPSSTRWRCLLNAGKFHTSSGSKEKAEIAPKNILKLHDRGLLEDIFPPASVHLPEQLEQKQCFYCGFDPTADSLHVGNLLSLMVLLHCQRAGHDVIAVIGTATVRAGDPSDRTTDRQAMSRDEIQSNARKIRTCIRDIFDNHEHNIYDNRGKKQLPELRIMRNEDWYRETSLIDFLSTTCRNFRIGPMMSRKFIRERIDSEEGLLLAEFMYQVLQSRDWEHLYTTHNCRFQIGGIDQLGNVSAGQHLIRRSRKGEVYGLFTPLVTTPRGQKLGKTAGNSVWLSSDKTPPFEFYQYFFRQPDAVCDKFLRYFTFINVTMIEEIMREHKKNPAVRHAQRILAKNVTKLVHGKAGLESAERCTRALYSGSTEDLEQLSPDEIDTTFAGTHIVHGTLEPDTTVYDVARLAEAIPEGVRGDNVIASGGLRINGKVETDPHRILLLDTHVLKNEITLLSVGKIRHHVIKWSLPRLQHSLEDRVESSVDLDESGDRWRGW